MKKILLSTVLAACSWAVFAQDTTMNNTNNTTTNGMNSTMNTNNSMNNQTYGTTSTSSYNAYGIPNYVEMNFQASHPNISNLMWDASTADYYHGYYNDPATGRYTHVYYSTDPYYNVSYYPERVTGWSVSLPVLQTWVPDEVVSQASNLYKQNLYDITAMKGTQGQDIYQVRLRENGELRTVWMDANGTAVTDIWRTEDMNTQTATNTTITTTESNAAMNSTDTNTKVKTKTKMSGGSEIKTKTKNGKTKTKTSGNTSSNDQY